MDQMNVSAWAGRTQSDAGVISDGSARQIHATLGQGSAPMNGDSLPPLWHWCAFPPDVPMDQLGNDGHPHDAGLLPPLRLKRRMWAGGSLRFIAPLRVGDPLRRRSAIRDITEKQGATGPMVLVTVDHAVYGPKGLAIEERQDIVFLDIPDRFTPPKPRALTGKPVARIQMTEALLFRYSALTFNAHRIHYDKAYTTQVEHYPDLVVHGPLQATLLMQAATQSKGRMPTLFEYRGVAPMFVGHDLHISIEEPNPATMVLMSGQNGQQGMRATAIWEETQ